MNQPSSNTANISLLFTSEVFLLALVLGAFLVGIYVYKRTRISLLQPILTAVIILIPFLKLTGISYDVFYQQTNLLNLMLGPCVVALGYVMYEELEQIKGNVLSTFTAVFVGSAVAIVSVVLIAKLFGADSTLLASLAPKSVTTPHSHQPGRQERRHSFVGCRLCGDMRHLWRHGRPHRVACFRR